MSTVYHPQARRLAALGFPQDRFPRMVWTHYGNPPEAAAVYGEGDFFGLEYGRDDFLRREALPKKWYAAPAYVSGDGQSGALEFVEREHGRRWMRLSPLWWLARPHDGSVVLNARSASELLDAILDRLEAAHSPRRRRRHHERALHR